MSDDATRSHAADYVPSGCQLEGTECACNLAEAGCVRGRRRGAFAGRMTPDRAADPWEVDPTVCWMCGRPAVKKDSAGLPVCKDWRTEGPPDE